MARTKRTAVNEVPLATRQRTIGIRHRVKRTAEGEARPTQVVIFDGMERQPLALETEQDELDFVHGRFPVSWRKVEDGEDLSEFRRHHIKARKLPQGEKPNGLHPSHLWSEGRDVFRAERVPSQYEGLTRGDRFAMILGGSGDSFAGALGRRGMEVGGRVYRIPPFFFDKYRSGADKDQDAARLAELLQQQPELFYEVGGGQDLGIIRMRECYRARMDAMKERIACEQRLRTRIIGELFRDEDYPEGAIEDEFESRKANDVILLTLITEERCRERELFKALEALDLYHKLFKPVAGVGPIIAARLLSAIIDFRRFIVVPDAEKVKALYAESKRLEEEANVETTIRRLLDAGEIPKDANRFRVLGIVAHEYFRVGLIEDGQRVNRALDLHQERSKLRRAARQKTAAKLRRYCGVHVNPDGTFPRRRHGKVANWQPDARQGLYLLATEQFNRRPDSEWGIYFRLAKIHFRQVHPEVEMVDGKKRYTDGHIHKMSIWRSLSVFVSQMAYAFLDLEKGEGVLGIHPPQKPTVETEAVA